MKKLREEVLNSPFDSGIYSLLMGGLCATINCTPDEIDTIDDGMTTSGTYTDIDEFIDGNVPYSFAIGRRILHARNEFVPYFIEKEKEDGIRRGLPKEETGSTSTEKLESTESKSTFKESVGDDNPSTTTGPNDGDTGHAERRGITEAEREAEVAHQRAEACSPDRVKAS